MYLDVKYLLGSSLFFVKVHDVVIAHDDGEVIDETPFLGSLRLKVRKVASAERSLFVEKIPIDRLPEIVYFLKTD